MTIQHGFDEEGVILETTGFWDANRDAVRVVLVDAKADIRLNIWLTPVQAKMVQDGISKARRKAKAEC